LINANLPLEDLRERYARDGRVLIDRILDPGVADALYECLLREIPWEVVFRRGSEVVTLTAPELSRLSPGEQEQLMARVHQQARNDFQFLYWKFSMVDAYRRQILPHLLTHRLLETLASAATIELVRRITGQADIRRVDAQATLYRPGNFLTAHSDVQHGEHGRRAAYVIQLCRDWKADWGGLLQFANGRSEVTETYTPRFNSMALFAVPQEHLVSMVAPFAPGPRFGITGWFTA
jgi:Rps23 Pro-64 3,4-dihydroxylase Tpa1-like proline 4-hydroxylase